MHAYKRFLVLKKDVNHHSGLDSRTSLAAFFEVVAGSRGNAPDVNAAPQFFLQFVTKYLHENGEFRCRVTTVTRTCGFFVCMADAATEYTLCPSALFLDWRELC